jgi:hypothetical protein
VKHAPVKLWRSSAGACNFSRTNRRRVMRKTITAVMLFVTIMLSFAALTGTAFAEELKMVGTITKIEMAVDNKSASIILKDVKSGADVTVVVNDELTLDKFNDKRIVDGDEIRCKYDNESGKNISKIFKKTAGC